MQLANRAATIKDRKVANFGYIILRPDKSFAEQVTEPNCIYEIRYEFDLNGDKISIDNSVLKFMGGSLRNGILQCIDVIISADMYCIFRDITFMGTLTAPNAYPEWFGAIGNDDNDDSEPIQKCLDLFKVVNLPPKKYKIDNTIYMPYGSKITGIGTIHSNGGFKVLELGLGCSVENVTINEDVAYEGISLSVAYLNETWEKANVKL
jgi:hypothetical protein